MPAAPAPAPAPAAAAVVCLLSARTFSQHLLWTGVFCCSVRADSSQNLQVAAAMVRAGQRYRLALGAEQRANGTGQRCRVGRGGERPGILIPGSAMVGTVDAAFPCTSAAIRRCLSLHFRGHSAKG